MDFDFSPEQYALRDEARRFLAEQSPSASVRRYIDDPRAWDAGLWKRMADLGWMALPFDESDGGLGQGFLDLVLLVGELGAAVAPVPFLSSVVLAGHAIAAHGSQEQRARLLPAIASGERIGTLALAERSGTFDASGVEAVAERDGDGWRVSGEKRAVLDVAAADLFVVAARDGDGARWFVVDEPSGSTVQTAFDLTRSVGTITLDATRAEALSAPGIAAGLRYAVAGACAEMVGTAQRILDMTVEYSKQREQFGRPIGSFQAIKHKCAEMATDLEAARSAALYACWAVATDAPDAELACSIAKSFCSDRLSHLANEGVQIHGGIAFTWEHDMHLYLKRIRSMQAFLGDESYHRERIAHLTEI